MASTSNIMGILTKISESVNLIDLPEGLGHFERVLLDGRPGKQNSNIDFFQRADGVCGPFFHVKLFRYLAFDLVKMSLVW